jgi:hypothetical protein
MEFPLNVDPDDPGYLHFNKAVAAQASRFLVPIFFARMPPLSMVGLATLTRSIGVRIPGGQPKLHKSFIIKNLEE